MRGGGGGGFGDGEGKREGGRAENYLGQYYKLFAEKPVIHRFLFADKNTRLSVVGNASIDKSKKKKSYHEQSNIRDDDDKDNNNSSINYKKIKEGKK